jgi:hypothetical protein
MKKGFLYSRVGIAGVACIVTGLLTLIVGLQAAHPTPDSPEPWYSWFLTPGLLGGMILIAPAGGVNRTPEWLQACAFLCGQYPLLGPRHLCRHPSGMPLMHHAITF